MTPAALARVAKSGKLPEPIVEFHICCKSFTLQVAINGRDFETQTVFTGFVLRYRPETYSHGVFYRKKRSWKFIEHTMEWYEERDCQH